MLHVAGQQPYNLRWTHPLSLTPTNNQPAHLAASIALKALHADNGVQLSSLRTVNAHTLCDGVTTCFTGRVVYLHHVSANGGMVLL